MQLSNEWQNIIYLFSYLFMIKSYRKYEKKLRSTSYKTTNYKLQKNYKLQMQSQQHIAKIMKKIKCTITNIQKLK